MDARDASWHQVFFFVQGKTPNEIQAILTETLACFRPGRAKYLSAPLYRVLLLLYISQGLPLLTPGSLQYTILILCLHIDTITLIICWLLLQYLSVRFFNPLWYFLS